MKRNRRQTVDTVILGRRTYDKVLSFGIDFPHADKESYVITRTPRTQEGNIRFYTGELKTLLANLKAKEGKHIFVDGGADVVNTLMKEDLLNLRTGSVVSLRIFHKPVFQIHHHRDRAASKARHILRPAIPDFEPLNAQPCTE